MKKEDFKKIINVPTIILGDIVALRITIETESILQRYGLDNYKGLPSLFFLIGIIGIGNLIIANKMQKNIKKIIK